LHTVAEPNRIGATLDLVAEIADLPGTAERLRAIAVRAGGTAIGEAADSREATSGGAADPRLARLRAAGRERRAPVGEGSFPIGAPRADRRAVVSSLVADGDFAGAEAAALRLLAEAVETRLTELEGRRGGAAERPLLSPRERECLQWTAAGKTTWEIAGILEISQNTIDGYIASATRKLGAVNRTQAVAEALRRAFID